MSRDERSIHTEHDHGLDAEHCKAVAWAAGLASVGAWLWLLLAVGGDGDGIGPGLRVLLQAVGTLGAAGAGTAAVLCGVKNVERRLRLAAGRD